ncbi:hypothetical protein [Chryseosolibacter indicus]|uniref:Uncharacterized protein n=1 Tax=Chryseosolibacter indicus TaxID=2782351 RepID=A0ABS5VXR6_9BACT|nr:hypothetical protein [Chryseosolibacter indicus]MBT1706194.1 hypothetical protein [Chryseosolibacter indicus]
MAYVKENDLTEGLSGKFGPKFVFKQLRGKTIVARRSKAVKTQSALQNDNRLRFKKATEYAKAMMLIAEKKAYYWKKAKKQKLPNAYTAAISDYLRKPEIIESTISVHNAEVTLKARAAKRDFAIKVMKVIAVGKDGAVVEQAEITKDFGYWRYKFKDKKEMLSKIILIVQDHAGNIISKDLELDQVEVPSTMH